MTAVIEIDPPTEEAERLWTRTLELATELGSDDGWSLIGGLMVQLHAFEQGSDSRRRPAMTSRIAEVLAERGATMALPPISAENLGYKFEVEGSIVEVLGSEGVRSDPNTLGKFTTFQVPGGTQALARSEIVQVSLAGAKPVAVRRPSLLGAILIKARVVRKQREKFGSDRQDLIRLLGFVDDPRALGKELKRTERRWLREVESLLDFADSALADFFDSEELAAAETAYLLLLEPPKRDR